MIAILEKYEQNVDFHPIVDFVEASYIRYALTINSTVYVSHIRQFWFTARIETTDEGTKILATVDGKPRTITESSIRRNLKLKDEAGISSLPDAELFKNLTLMGYNILPNQKFSFQKVPFHILPLRVNSPSFSGRTVPLFLTMLVTMGEGSGTPTEPHHTPSPEAQQSPQHDLSSSIHPPVTTATIPTVIPTDLPLLSQREACPTVSGLEARQDRANITKSSTLPYDLTPRVTSLAADEGTSLKAKIKMLEDKDGRVIEPSGEDATIKGRSLETREEATVKKSTERGSNDTEELVNVLTSLDAANILTSEGVQVVSVSPAAEVPTKRKKKMVESDAPKKKKIQKHIDVQMAREMEEQLAREDQRMSEQIAKDAEIARIHAEQFAADLDIRERIELINDLVKYQDNYAKVLKYQSQQRNPLSKKQQREFYISVLKIHSGWKAKHFKGMSLEEIREKFIPVWKQIEDFVPMSSKEKEKRFKRKWLRLEQESAKTVKTS
nr:hypothetical protein [Tanacetum cinerariifolium]